MSQKPRVSGAINVNSTFDLEYWAAKLRISPGKLRELVLSKGPRVEDVVVEIERGKSDSEKQDVSRSRSTR